MLLCCLYRSGKSRDASTSLLTSISLSQITSTAMGWLSSFLEPIGLLWHKYHSCPMQDRLASRYCPWEQVRGLESCIFPYISFLFWLYIQLHILLITFHSFLKIFTITHYFSFFKTFSLQHWWKVWCGLLRQRADHQRRLDVLAASCHLSQHLCHRDHLLPIWLSKLHAGIQVRHSLQIIVFDHSCGALDEWKMDLPAHAGRLSPAIVLGQCWGRKWGKTHNCI